MPCSRIHCSWKEVKAFCTGAVITGFIFGLILAPKLNEKPQNINYCTPVRVSTVIFNVSDDVYGVSKNGTLATLPLNNTTVLDQANSTEGAMPGNESGKSVSGTGETEKGSSATKRPAVQVNSTLNFDQRNKNFTKESSVNGSTGAKKSGQEGMHSKNQTGSNHGTTTTERIALTNSLSQPVTPSPPVRNSAATLVHGVPLVVTTVFISNGYYKIL